MPRIFLVVLLILFDSCHFISLDLQRPALWGIYRHHQVTIPRNFYNVPLWYHFSSCSCCFSSCCFSGFNMLSMSIWIPFFASLSIQIFNCLIGIGLSCSVVVVMVAPVDGNLLNTICSYSTG